MGPQQGRRYRDVGPESLERIASHFQFPISRTSSKKERLLEYLNVADLRELSCLVDLLTRSLNNACEQHL